MVSTFSYYLHQSVMVLVQIPWSRIVTSPAPPLRLPYAIHYNQHIYRMKERLAGVIKHLGSKFTALYHFFLFHSHPFWSLLMYLLVTSFMGFLVLKASRIRNTQDIPKNIDMFFTAVSVTTVSSMSTVEMEVFSNSQLIVLTILMLLGGEIFTSLLGLQFKRLRYRNNIYLVNQNSADIELSPNTVIVTVISDGTMPDMPERNKDMRHSATLYLSYVVLGYLVVIQVGGIVAIMAYLYSVSDARTILRTKGLNIITFSIFSTVSSFSNCGFLPTNENMIVFMKNLGLLLIIVPQSLLGGTMYSPTLRLVLWFLKKMTKRKEFEYILRDEEQIGYDHLFPWLHSVMLAFTVLGFLIVQFVTICAMEWRNEVWGGLSVYDKVVNYFFLAVNARHTGESTVDLSTMTTAILVLFVLMMYLPPCTTFMPFKDKRSNRREESNGMDTFLSVTFSHFLILAISVMTICITERDRLSEDPLNFNFLSIIFEVVSAYGNVGYSIGYSCSRQLTTDSTCQDLWTGFVGRWSNSGKVVLIVVMFFGRLKRYIHRGGNAWKLS